MPLFCTLSHASVAPAPQEEIENVEARLNALHGALKEAQAQLADAVATCQAHQRARAAAERAAEAAEDSAGRQQRESEQRMQRAEAAASAAAVQVGGGWGRLLQAAAAGACFNPPCCCTPAACLPACPLTRRICLPWSSEFGVLPACRWLSSARRWLGWSESGTSCWLRRSSGSGQPMKPPLWWPLPAAAPATAVCQPSGARPCPLQPLERCPRRLLGLAVAAARRRCRHRCPACGSGILWRPQTCCT